MAEVNARFLLIKKKVTGVDPLVDLILSDDPVLKPRYDKAYGWYKSGIKRGYIESCLIASRSIEDIASLLTLDIETLRLFQTIFFDIQESDKLSLLELVEEESKEDVRGMKLWALSQGLDFLAWRLGKSITVNPVEGLQELFTLSVYKSKEAMFTGNSSVSSMEAVKWTKLSMDLARLLKAWVMDSSAAKKDIELALKSINPTFEGIDSLDDLSGLDLKI